MTKKGGLSVSEIRRITSPRSILALLGGGILLAALMTGCSSEARLARHRKQAAESFENEQYEACIVACMNILKLDPDNKDALRWGALAHLRTGQLQQAVFFLLKAAEVMPEDVDLRVQLARLYQRAKHHDKAWQESAAILEVMPTNIPALFTLVETAGSTNEIARTEAALTAQAKALEDNARYHVARGSFELRLGNIDAARQAYRKARTIDPDSSMASLALARLNALEGKPERARTEYAAAVKQTPENLLAWLRWADFELKSGDAEAAAGVLDKARQAVVESPLLQYYEARVALAQREVDRGLELLDQVLEQNPGFTDAKTLRAGALLAKGEADAAADIYETLLKQQPDAFRLRHRLALARIQQGRVQEAKLELERTVARRPDDLPAALLLARLNMRTGDPDAAIEVLRPLAASHPDNVTAHLQLAAALLADDRTEQAEDACRQALSVQPDSARAHYLLAGILLAQEDAAGARQAFLATLERAPRFLPALSRLVALDLRARQGAEAIGRLDAYLEQFPDDAAATLLRGQTHLALDQREQAKEWLLKAIDIEPNLTGAYMNLGRLYAASGNVDEALAEYEKARKLHPTNPSIRMIQAVLYQGQDETDKAVELYEEILTDHPGFLAAANNLAYVYAQDPETLSRAYDLLQPAYESASDNPYITDTFGWILFKRGEHRWAFSVLQNAGEALAAVPEALYHRAMAHYAMGHTEEAVALLRQALAGDSPFEGRETAERSLSVLELDLEQGSADEALQRARAALDETPNLLPAQVVQAAAYSMLGQHDDAVRAYEKITEDAPLFTPAWTALAELYASDTARLDKAVKAAERARELAPESSRIKALAGWVQYLHGDYERALALLREGARRIEDDPQVAYRLGLAYFSQGDIPSATQEVQRAVAMGHSFPQQDDANRFLETMRWYAGSASSGRVPASVRGLLADKPGSGPALLVAAAVAHREGQDKEAIAHYNALLEKYPAFAPAKARLAELYADDAEMEDRAYELAAEARRALPDDARLAATQGRLALARGEEAYAAVLLKEAIGVMPDNGQAHFYLAKCQVSQGQAEEAAASLRRALSADPDAEFAAEAREELARLESNDTE